MANYASGQQVAANPGKYLVGVPTQALLDGDSFGSQNITDLTVGAPAYFSTVTDFAGNRVVTATYTANAFCGIVARSNAGPMSFGDSVLGYSTTIPANIGAQILVRTSVPILLAAATESGSFPLYNSAIYITTAGAFNSVADGDTPPTNAQKTNFRVRTVPAGWVAGGVIEVTNTQNVGA